MTIKYLSFYADIVKAELALLSLLMKEDMYGVEMVKRILIKPSTVYSALKIIERKKYANTYEKESKIGGRKRVYSITGTGREYYNENKGQIDFKIVNIPPQIKQEPDDDYDDIITDNKPPKTYDNGIFILPLSKEEQSHVNITPEVAQAIEEQSPIETDSLPQFPTFEIEETPAPLESAVKKPAVVANKLFPEIPHNTTDYPFPAEMSQQKEPGIREPADTALSESETPPPVTTPYILPKEKILSTAKMPPRQISISISGTTSPEINPLPKLNTPTEGYGFVLYNKLKFFANFTTVSIIVLISCGLTLLFATPAEYEELIILSFVLSGIYLVINLLVWIVFPHTKRKITPKFANSLTVKRTLSSSMLLLAVLSLYLIVNAHAENTSALFWGIVFAIASLTPAVESIFILLFQKIKAFTC